MGQADRPTIPSAMRRTRMRRFMARGQSRSAAGIELTWTEVSKANATLVLRPTASGRHGLRIRFNVDVSLIKRRTNLVGISRANGVDEGCWAVLGEAAPARPLRVRVGRTGVHRDPP